MPRPAPRVAPATTAIFPASGFVMSLWTSQVPCLGRLLLPSVVPAVFVPHGRLRELLGRGVVQARDVDGVEEATEFFQMSASERLHAATAVALARSLRQIELALEADLAAMAAAFVAPLHG